MTKLLNLDDLATPERTVRYKGEIHKVEELTVETFIEMQKDLEEVQAANEKNDNVGLIVAGTKIIKRSVPTMAESIGKLNDRQVLALVMHIANTYPQDDAAPKAEAPAEAPAA
jgi:hypothetical protein